ncbi:nucleoside triphosphate pyrophosphohydrolase [bacterium]|nr:nucleoside triphosphate pyrophosphohydrolase [bacterium]
MTESPYTRLLRIMHTLRSETGCPWDREQTSESLKPYLIEETYELLDAIEHNEPVAIKEELGDLLLQIVFHAQIWQEKSFFTMDDVIETLCAKLIHRHPHVFGEVTVANSEQVLRNWEKIKQSEPNHATRLPKSVLEGVPQNLPALLKAQRVQEKVSRVGFDWPDWHGAVAKIQEELAEVQLALDQGPTGQKHLEEELGDLLFSCVNLARIAGGDAETILNRAVEKFKERFTRLEHNFARQQVPLNNVTLAELDRQWNLVKEQEPNRQTEQ